MLSCAPYFSSGGGQVGNPFLPPSLFPFPLPLLASIRAFITRYSRREGGARCCSGLYPMYTHMMKQRRKVFGGRKLGVKPKTI